MELISPIVDVCTITLQIQILSDADRDRDVLSDKCWMKSISPLGDVYTITSKSYTLPLIHDICFIWNSENMRTNALHISDLMVMFYNKGEPHHHQVKIDEDGDDAYDCNDAFFDDDDDTY